MNVPVYRMDSPPAQYPVPNVQPQQVVLPTPTWPAAAKHGVFTPSYAQPQPMYYPTPMPTVPMAPPPPHFAHPHMVPQKMYGDPETPLESILVESNKR